jgi:hypothetical protein
MTSLASFIAGVIISQPHPQQAQINISGQPAAEKKTWDQEVVFSVWSTGSSTREVSKG